jgi:hypothetical protein
VKFDITKMIVKDPQSEWYEPGTQGTAEFVTPVKSDLGHVSFRCTGNFVRVRIVPSDREAATQLADKFARGDGWKQPDLWSSRTFRYSKMFYTADEAIEAVEFAIKALGKSGRKRQPGYVRFWRMAIRHYVSRPTAVAV